jgi:hypothetical protein
MFRRYQSQPVDRVVKLINPWFSGSKPVGSKAMRALLGRVFSCRTSVAHPYLRPDIGSGLLTARVRGAPVGFAGDQGSRPIRGEHANCSRSQYSRSKRRLNQNTPLAQQGLPAASSRTTSLGRKCYCLPRGRRSASSLQAYRAGSLARVFPSHPALVPP